MTETDFYLGILQGIHDRVGELKDALPSASLCKAGIEIASLGKNKISALSVFAIPLLAYVLRILPRTKTDPQNIQNSAGERMKLPRDIRDRSAVDLAA